jgi:hypothetical protein
MEIQVEKDSRPIIKAYDENTIKPIQTMRKRNFTNQIALNFIDVTTHVGCPCNCLKYCPQEVLLSRYKGARTFSIQSFQRALASVPESVEISFSGVCEPFTNRNTINLMQYAYDCGHPVSLFSTFYGASPEDIEQLANIPLNRFVLHLWDGEVMNFQLTQEYMKNVFRAIQVVKAEYSNVMFMKEGAFKSHNRENLVRRLIRESHSVGYCDSLRVPQFELLPNGDVQLCCMDFGLEHTLGNLLTEDYRAIKDRFNKTKHFSLCERCSHSITPTQHCVRTVIGYARKCISILR